MMIGLTIFLSTASLFFMLVHIGNVLEDILKTLKGDDDE